VVFVIPDKLKIELTNLPSPCVQSYTFGSIYPARPGLIFPQVFVFVPLYLLTTTQTKFRTNLIRLIGAVSVGGDMKCS